MAETGNYKSGRRDCFYPKGLNSFAPSLAFLMSREWGKLRQNVHGISNG